MLSGNRRHTFDKCMFSDVDFLPSKVLLFIVINYPLRHPQNNFSGFLIDKVMSIKSLLYKEQIMLSFITFYLCIGFCK